jgi:RimJ/RimL family protein N-acetyltransferase
MVEAATYSVVERLRDGRSVEIRALRSDDRADFLKGIERISTASLRRRFFTPRRSFAEGEIDFFVNVDFVHHVALVAVIDQASGPAIVGSGRFIVTDPEEAELAFTVGDAYQGQGICTLLMGHLATIARQSGIKQLVADVLPENVPMLTVFRKSGLEIATRFDFHTVHVTLGLG